MTTHTPTTGRITTQAQMLADTGAQALLADALRDVYLLGVPAALGEDAARDGRTVATAPAPGREFGAVATAPKLAVGLDTTTWSRAGILPRSDRPAPSEVR